ncbi:MAG: DinB family protein [Caldilineaceae bacterium]|nr:DinB family protein [Caldilineaceae bacterium]
MTKKDSPMHSHFQAYLERLATLHNDIVTVLDRLPQAALDWKPAPTMNSIAVLIAHSAGAETYWIGDVTLRRSSERVRATEFTVGGLDHADLKARLDQALADAQATLAQLTIEQLTEERYAPSQERNFTVGWCLLHALEHTATHVGHVQLMGDMWERLHVERHVERREELNP